MAAVVQEMIQILGDAEEKQQKCHKQSVSAIDSLIKSLETIVQSYNQMDTQDDSTQTDISQIKKTAEQNSLMPFKNQESVSKCTKEYIKGVSNVVKICDREFESDITKSSRDAKFKTQIIDKVIVEHLYRQGRFDLGAQLAEEASLPHQAPLRQPYEQMHLVLARLQQNDFDAALQWTLQQKGQSDRVQLTQSLEFKLHTMKFLGILHGQGTSRERQAAALAYARKEIAQYSKQYQKQFQRLICSLLFEDGGDLSHTPYQDMQIDSTTDDIAKLFVKNCCSLLGQASQSPLLVVVAAGNAALPQLLKLVDIVTQPLTKGSDIKTCDRLPMEVNIGKEFYFHSIFACPVSKDMSTTDNPPVLLPCGHVLCKNSVKGIAKSSSRSFKCPYCPAETYVDKCLDLTFPDIE